jgi:thiopeptide-type bacteriocin biosynthesis protein
MMTMQIDPTVMYRVPQFSFQSTMIEKWDELKLSIANSSPEFYKLIRDTRADEISLLPEAVRLTLWKYFNRACYRGTPYASFASIGLCKIGNRPEQKLLIDQQQVLHSFNDWKQTERFTCTMDELIEKNALLMANSSYYLVGEQIRYIGRFDGKYELTEIPKEEPVLHVLLLCSSPLLIAELMLHLAVTFDEQSSMALIASMVEDQLLISGFHANLIGEDYFERMDMRSDLEAPQYIIAERTLISGELPGWPLRHLPTLIEQLYRLLPSHRPSSLSEFAARFARKFGDREVPLMVALDPELGVGYGDMEQSVTDDELTVRLLKNKALKTVEKESVMDLLLRRVLEGGQEAIDIEKLHSTTPLKNEPLANSIGILCSYSGGMLQVEHISPCTANSLLGRFSLTDTPIRALCKSIAQAEHQANPDVIFFDIAYAAGGAVDNVNRRWHIYPSELSIACYDTSIAPLTLDDLWLSLSGDNLVLTSQKLSKRVVPKMASAYNYQLSDLSLFRFLCDLQHQGIHSNFSLRLRDSIADLDHYPRVYYKNIILSPQTWLVDFKDVGRGLEVTTPEAMLKYFEGNKLPRFLKTGSGDQTLLIDLYNEVDVISLFQLLGKQKKLYVEEALNPSGDVVRDECGAGYYPQFLLSLSHGRNIYDGMKREYSFRRNRPQLVPPGGDWLYFEVYCHPHRSNELLMEVIAPFIRRRNLEIYQWFFIRYTENGNHLRLRLKLYHPSEAQTLQTEFAGVIAMYMQSGMVSDLQIKTYRRETERYGIANLPMVEAHFCKDSAYVLTLLDRDAPTSEKYSRCIRLMEAIEQSEVLGHHEYRTMAVSSLMAYSTEHDLQPAQFKELNKAYQDHLKEAELLETPEDLENMIRELETHWIMVLQHYLAGERAQILTAMLHMHINRLFSSNQRTHETVIYYFMQKDFQRNSRRKVNPSMQGK